MAKNMFRTVATVENGTSKTSSFVFRMCRTKIPAYNLEYFNDFSCNSYFGIL